MKLTPDQRSAVEHIGHLCLVSCPGSGKTRTIVAKLLQCVDAVRDTPRRVACITYTNAGVYEIEARMRQWGSYGDDDYYEATTIHSFCLNNILRPFGHLIPELCPEWSLVTADDEWYQLTMRELGGKHGLSGDLRDKFERITRVFPTGILSGDLPPQVAEEFCSRTKADRKVTFSDSLYYSARLISENPYIARSLASRFAWLIVDEFQDTTTAQLAVLKAIVSYGRSTVFFVGDPNQSIYGFAGARQESMAEFASSISAATHITLSGNYRCSAEIVARAELLCPCTPSMQAVGEHSGFGIAPRLVHCEGPIVAVFDHFLPAIDALGIELGQAAVMTLSWQSLRPIGEALIKRGVAVHGPGARPYKRSHEFAALAEEIAAFISAPNDADQAFAALRALYQALLNVNGDADGRVYSYDGKRVLFRLVNFAKTVRDKSDGAADWLRTCAKAFGYILIEEEFLAPAHRRVFSDSAEAMIAEMRQHKFDVVNLTVQELGFFASPKDAMQLLTLHRSKGREFDAVAVLACHDGTIPYFRSTPAEIVESGRLMYVATTRARKLLMFFTDSRDARNKPSRYLRTMGLV